MRGRSVSRATRKGAIVGAFVAHPLELRRSPAWRALSDEGRRLLARLELEHMEHGGAANGALACTYADFVDDGMRRTSIPGAIRECVALGFLAVTQQGRPAISDFRRPNLYRLTYLNGRDRSPEPTHEWRSIGTDEAASAAVAKAAQPSKRPTRPRHSEGHSPEDIDSRPKYGLTL